LSSLATDEYQKIFVIELCGFLVDSGARFCIGNTAVRCGGFENYDAREFGNLNAEEAFVRGLNRGRPARRGLSPTKLINE